MQYVILRDDDTNALTPVDCLETLFRPFLDRGLPVTLSIIPHVKTTVIRPDGKLEAFLMARKSDTPETLPIGSCPQLIQYILDNPGYHVAQHGYHHEVEEFASPDGEELARRLDAGIRDFIQAGLPRARAFVAPQDKLSKAALIQLKARFPIISSSWFELSQIPLSWWPYYAVKKALRQEHWRVGKTQLLTRPVQQISYLQPYDTILECVRQQVRAHSLLILLTHWWEFFRDGRRDERLISVLHQVADFLSTDPNVRVISFDDL